MGEKNKRVKEDIQYCSENCYLLGKSDEYIKYIYLNEEESQLLNLISRTFEINPCISYLSLKYRFNSRHTCQELNKYIIRAKFSTRKFVYKDTPRVTKAKYFPDRIYQPCSHFGPCDQAVKCRCFKLKQYCEPYCLCQSCNNIVRCSCTNCNTNCPCYKLNRECTSFCHVNCKNKPIQNEIHKLTLVRESKKAGYGLFAGENIKDGEFVIEYTGELISNSEADRRGFFYDLKKMSYLFDITQNDDEFTTLDATRIGNNSRFINHGDIDENNILTKPVMVNGRLKMAMFASRNIKDGEELFFNYNYSSDDKRAHNMQK